MALYRVVSTVCRDGDGVRARSSSSASNDGSRRKQKKESVTARIASVLNGSWAEYKATSGASSIVTVDGNNGVMIRGETYSHFAATADKMRREQLASLSDSNSSVSTDTPVNVESAMVQLWGGDASLLPVISELVTKHMSGVYTVPELDDSMNELAEAYARKHGALDILEKTANDFSSGLRAVSATIPQLPALSAGTRGLASRPQTIAHTFRLTVKLTIHVSSLLSELLYSSRASQDLRPAGETGTCSYETWISITCSAKLRTQLFDRYQSIVPVMMAAAGILDFNVPLLRRPQICLMSDTMMAVSHDGVARAHGLIRDMAATGAGFQECIQTGFNALSGIHEGGVIEQCGRLLKYVSESDLDAFTALLDDNVAAPEFKVNTESDAALCSVLRKWFKENSNTASRLPGFGHSVIKGENPRSIELKQLLQRYVTDITRARNAVLRAASEETDSKSIHSKKLAQHKARLTESMIKGISALQMGLALERVALDFVNTRRDSDHKAALTALHSNEMLWQAVIYDALGIPSAMMSAVSATAHIPGFGLDVAEGIQS